MPSQSATAHATGKRAAPATRTRAAAAKLKEELGRDSRPVSTAPIKLYTGQPEEVEMVPLFSIDDVDYLIPARPNALMAIRYLEEVKKTGSPDMAMGVLLEELLGEDAYRALLAFKGHMTPDQLQELFQAAQAAVVGLVEVPKGD